MFRDFLLNDCCLGGLFSSDFLGSLSFGSGKDCPGSFSNQSSG
jgi:hypothetical protein